MHTTDLVTTETSYNRDKLNDATKIIHRELEKNWEKAFSHENSSANHYRQGQSSLNT